MCKLLLTEASLCLLVLLLLGFHPGEVLAQYDADIRFPSQPVEGRPIGIEMLEDSCNGFTFISELYDVEIVGSTVTASVDAIGHGIDPCPPGGVYGWRTFSLTSLPAGGYELSIYMRPFAGGSPDPIGPPTLYGSTSFTVLAAPQPNFIPVLSLSGWVLLVSLALTLGMYQLRRT